MTLYCGLRQAVIVGYPFEEAYSNWANFVGRGVNYFGTVPASWLFLGIQYPTQPSAGMKAKYSR